jgi:hypothetical protein
VIAAPKLEVPPPAAPKAGEPVEEAPKPVIRRDPNPTRRFD